MKPRHPRHGAGERDGRSAGRRPEGKPPGRSDRSRATSVAERAERFAEKRAERSPGQDRGPGRATEHTPRPADRTPRGPDRRPDRKAGPGRDRPRPVEPIERAERFTGKRPRSAAERAERVNAARAAAAQLVEPRSGDRPAGRRNRSDDPLRSRGMFGAPAAAADTTGARPQRSRGQFQAPEPGLPPAPLSGPMRIAKAMARAGLCSRRDAEGWIAEGRVRVNGRVIVSPALDVGPEHRIEVDGQPLPGAAPPLLWRYHKPKGLVTTHRDPEGRPTVFDKLPAEIGRVISVGRLDVSSEGLLLITNDGALARHMELPATGWLRRYRVRAHGRITAAALEKIAGGIEVDGVQYGPIEATLDSQQGANVWLTLGLREGKNREVRKVLGALGLDVNRLIRISYGPFQLLDLPPGQVEPVKRRVLMDQLGPQLQRQFGLLDVADAERARRTKARDDARKGAPGSDAKNSGGDNDRDEDA